MNPKLLPLKAVLAFQILVLLLLIFAVEFMYLASLGHFEIRFYEFFMNLNNVALFVLGLYSSVNLFRGKPSSLLQYSAFAASLVAVIGMYLLELGGIKGMGPLLYVYLGFPGIVVLTLLLAIPGADPRRMRPQSLLIILGVPIYFCVSFFVATYFLNWREHPLWALVNPMKSQLVRDARFQDIQFGCRADGSLIELRAALASEADGIALQAAVENAHPPVPVQYLLQVLPPFPAEVLRTFFPSKALDELQMNPTGNWQIECFRVVQSSLHTPYGKLLFYSFSHPENTVLRPEIYRIVMDQSCYFEGPSTLAQPYTRGIRFSSHGRTIYVFVGDAVISASIDDRPTGSVALTPEGRMRLHDWFRAVDTHDWRWLYLSRGSPKTPVLYFDTEDVLERILPLDPTDRSGLFSLISQTPRAPSQAVRLSVRGAPAPRVSIEAEEQGPVL